MRTANSNKSIEIAGDGSGNLLGFQNRPAVVLIVPIHNKIPVTVDTTWRAQ